MELNIFWTMPKLRQKPNDAEFIKCVNGVYFYSVKKFGQIGQLPINRWDYYTTPHQSVKCGYTLFNSKIEVFPKTISLEEYLDHMAKKILKPDKQLRQGSWEDAKQFFQWINGLCNSIGYFLESKLGPLTDEEIMPALRLYLSSIWDEEQLKLLDQMSVVDKYNLVALIADRTLE